MSFGNLHFRLTISTANNCNRFALCVFNPTDLRKSSDSLTGALAIKFQSGNLDIKDGQNFATVYRVVVK